VDKDKPIDIELCMGSACFARGNNDTAISIENYIKKHGLDKKVTVRGALCEGNCLKGPNMKINGESCRCKGGEIPALLIKLKEEGNKK
jgi:NADH:ubiquinone oxidoreductase subunit E